MPEKLYAFRWFGGKVKSVDVILPLLPQHVTYVEPFGGAMAILLNKNPSPVEVYNDIDGDLVNFWRVVRDQELFSQLIIRLSLTCYSREEFYDAARVVRNSEPSRVPDVERAAQWYTVIMQSVSGCLDTGWGYSVGSDSRGMARVVASWLSRLEALPLVHERLSRVMIEHDDWRAIFDRYDTTQTCFYCDPPYIPDTRRGVEYAHELSFEDHQELVERLLSIKGTALLSGYDHPVYAPLTEHGWRLIRREVSCHAAGKTRGTNIIGDGATWVTGQRRTECLWVSPGATRQLAIW